jgi:hypothetical protein
MKCDELKLFLALEGNCTKEEEQDIKGHIARCKRCRTKYERMDLAINAFTAYYRGERRGLCPTAEEIVRIQEGDVDSHRLERLNKHIDSCLACQAELQLLKKCDEEENVDVEGGLAPPLLSPAVQHLIALRQQVSLRNKMEHVLKTLLDKGKEALTPEKINELVEKYLLPAGEPMSVYAMPSDASDFDTELNLNSNEMCNITITIRKCTLSIRVIDDILTVKVTRSDEGVSGVDVIVMTKSQGQRIVSTDNDGICAIAGIQQGPSQISIRVPDE